MTLCNIPKKSAEQCCILNYVSITGYHHYMEVSTYGSNEYITSSLLSRYILPLLRK